MTASESEHLVVRRFRKHVNPAFIKMLGMLGYGRVYERAEGLFVWDHQGRRYLDFLAGFGSVPLGHNHPKLLSRLRAFLDEGVPNLMHVGPSPQAAELAERLAQLAGPPLEVVLFSSSGAEAVEAGLKLARAATGRAEVIYCQGGFHGTNLGTLSVMGAPRMREPFEPLLPHCHETPFGDLPALERALARKKAACYLVEPIQVEGGIQMPPPGYLKAARELCRRAGTLLVLDEVQTGLGRTGTWFAFQQEGFVPDVLVLAKALSGGLAPIAATLVTRAAHRKAYGRTARFDLHGSTFAGNPLSAVCAMETLRILEAEELPARAGPMGQRLRQGLAARLAGHPLVRDIRGRGLLVGLELGPTETGRLNRMAPSLVKLAAKGIFGHWLALKLLERGIIAQPATHRTDVLRLEPPLTVGPEEVDTVIEQLGAVLDEYPSIGEVLKDAGARLVKQYRNGGAFL